MSGIGFIFRYTWQLFIGFTNLFCYLTFGPILTGPFSLLIQIKKILTKNLNFLTCFVDGSNIYQVGRGDRDWLGHGAGWDNVIGTMFFYNIYNICMELRKSIILTFNLYINLLYCVHWTIRLIRYKENHKLYKFLKKHHFQLFLILKCYWYCICITLINVFFL